MARPPAGDGGGAARRSSGGERASGRLAVCDLAFGRPACRALPLRRPSMINFVSHLPKDLRTGGFSAMNAAACAALERRHEIAYVGPIDPPVTPWEKALSKALRLSGLAGDFPAYSERRLATIAREVERQAPTR